MSSEINLMWEEYKLLNEESRAFTNATFRDLHILATLVVAFIALMATSDEHNMLENFWVIAIAQSVFYVFLLIQLSRVVYLFTLRRHLLTLERRLNDNGGEDRLAWESEIVPTQIASPWSLNAHAKSFIGIIYIIGFAALTHYGLSLLPECSDKRPYHYVVAVQCAIYIYILGRLGAQRIKQWWRERKEEQKEEKEKKEKLMKTELDQLN